MWHLLTENINHRKTGIYVLGDDKPKLITMLTMLTTSIVKSKVKYKFGQDITIIVIAISQVTGLIE